MSEKNIEKIVELYLREREYQKKIFGNYNDDTSLSFPSFLLFLQSYIEKAINEYTKNWERELPLWLTSCKEYDNQGVAPIKSYEEIIKIMALAGAALETYAEVNPKLWRIHLESVKKKNEKGEEEL